MASAGHVPFNKGGGANGRGGGIRPTADRTHDSLDQGSGTSTSTPAPSADSRGPEQGAGESLKPPNEDSLSFAGGGEKWKRSGVSLFFESCTPDKHGKKNVRCTVTRIIPARGGIPGRKVVCGTKYTYKSRGDGLKGGTGTSGLLTHLREKHPDQAAQVDRGGINSMVNKDRREIAAANAINTKSSTGVGAQPSIRDHVIQRVSVATMDAHFRRYVIMCAVDSRSCNMAAADGFKLFTAGLFPPFARSKHIHHTTFDKILAGLSGELTDSIMAQLQRQYDSTRKLGWKGPFVSIQMDLTTTHNTEYCTMSVSFVPDDFSELVRLAIGTKAFPGRHTQAEVEDFVRKETIRFFEPIRGNGMCEPSDIYVAATVDQGGNIVNAFKNMGVPLLEQWRQNTLE